MLDYHIKITYYHLKLVLGGMELYERNESYIEEYGAKAPVIEQNEDSVSGVTIKSFFKPI